MQCLPLSSPAVCLGTASTFSLDPLITENCDFKITLLDSFRVFRKLKGARTHKYTCTYSKCRKPLLLPSSMSERGETDSAETQTESDSSNFKQIMPYKSFYQVRNCAESKFGLRRVLIQDLPHQDNLDGCYVGGKILDVVPSSSPGTGSMVFVEDDNNLVVEKLHGTLKISQELMDQLPSLKIGDQFMLFVGGASLEESCEDTETQYTQDTGMCRSRISVRGKTSVEHRRRNIN